LRFGAAAFLMPGNLATFLMSAKSRLVKVSVGFLRLTAVVLFFLAAAVGFFFFFEAAALLLDFFLCDLALVEEDVVDLRFLAVVVDAVRLRFITADSTAEFTAELIVCV
jgi:hypothetical protein